MSTAAKVRVVITGGGTGGHVFPGLALAEALRRRGAVDVRFVGCRGRLEGRLVPAAGWPLLGIAARGLKGVGPWRAVSNAAVLAIGLVQSLWHLARTWPRLVVGMGGYVAGPVLAAAWLLGRKIAVHEQNLRPGWANRSLSRLADLVMVSWPETAAAFPRSRVAVTGNPVRRQALAGPREERTGGGFRLLVLGGSQGASGLNRLVTAAVGELDREGLEVVHQAGAADRDAVREAYDARGVPAEVVPFIEEVGKSYAWADAVVCRAGATTLAELAVNGLPAVLVPFPGAAEGHQSANARHLADRGAALVVEEAEGPGSLARAIDALRGDAGRRRALGVAATALARPTAADDMARACLELVGVA